jgi:ribosomal protein L18
MIKRFNANKARLQRHQRMRNHVKGSQIRPRLNVFRSEQHIYAQIIDDTTGKTLVAASSLDENLKGFTVSLQEKASNLLQAVADKVTETVEMAADALPSKGKGAKTEKAAAQQQKAPAKGQPQKGAPGKGGKPGPTAQVKTILPAAEKGARKTPLEALAPIANNRKVATAHEVGKLVGQRAKEKGINRVVFDRGGYAYHGRVAALAEGVREAGLEF